MRILNIQEIKTIPHVPLSHPFVELRIPVKPISDSSLNRSTIPVHADQSRSVATFRDLTRLFFSPVNITFVFLIDSPSNSNPILTKAIYRFVDVEYSHPTGLADSYLLAMG